MNQAMMGLGDLRQSWKNSRAWGKSVPEVPEDHVDIPKRGIGRFNGNHGAWMVPLGLLALVLCTLATLSAPIYEPMSFLDITLKADLPGGSGTVSKLKVGLWGLCLSGADGDCSKPRGLFSGFGKVVSDLPEHLRPFQCVPLSRCHLYLGVIYAAWSATFFEQKQRRTVQGQDAAMMCFCWVVICISISLGLQIGLYCTVKENIGKTNLKDYIQTGVGASIWIWVAALSVMIYAATNWITWRYKAKRGTWKPDAWMQYIGGSQPAPDRAEASGRISSTETKQAENQREKGYIKHFEELSTFCHDSELPAYAVTAPQNEIPGNQREEEATASAARVKESKASVAGAALAPHASSS